MALMLESDGSLLNGGNVSGNGGGFFALPTVTRQTLPPFQGNFDISQASISRAVSQGNTREDILSAYQAFTTGILPRDRVGGYIQNDINRYGYASIRDAAAGYLQAAGLALLQPIQAVQETFASNDDIFGDFFALPFEGFDPQNPLTNPTTTTPDTTVKNPFEILADAFAKAFGVATPLQPLQSQAYGYTPVKTSVPTTTGITGKSSNIGTLVILGVVGVVAYFIYKRYKGT